MREKGHNTFSLLSFPMAIEMWQFNDIIDTQSTDRKMKAVNKECQHRLKYKPKDGHVKDSKGIQWQEMEKMQKMYIIYLFIIY